MATTSEMTASMVVVASSGVLLATIGALWWKEA
jgi:hypothetical protein